MTIDSAYWPEKRNNHGGTVYQFGFEIIDPTYIEVFAIDAYDVYTLIDAADYTVEIGTYIAPISKGGYITFDAALDASVAAISIQRKTDITDEQEFPTGQPFNAESFEFQCDKLTMILQEINASVCDCSVSGGSGGPSGEPVEPGLPEVPLVYHGGESLRYLPGGRVLAMALNPSAGELYITPLGYDYYVESADSGASFGVPRSYPNSPEYPKFIKFAGGAFWISVDRAADDGIDIYTGNFIDGWSHVKTIYGSSEFYIQDDGSVFVTIDKLSATVARVSVGAGAWDPSPVVSDLTVYTGMSYNAVGRFFDSRNNPYTPPGPHDHYGQYNYIGMGRYGPNPHGNTFSAFSGGYHVHDALAGGASLVDKFVTNGEDCVYISTTIPTNTYEIRVYTHSSNVDNPADFEVDFGESLRNTCLAFGNGKFLACAVGNSVGRRNKLMIHSCDAGDYENLAFLAEITLTSDHLVETPAAIQIEYWGAGWWLVAYTYKRTGGLPGVVLKVEKFHLTF